MHAILYMGDLTELLRRASDLPITVPASEAAYGRPYSVLRDGVHEPQPLVGLFKSTWPMASILSAGASSSSTGSATVSPS